MTLDRRELLVRGGAGALALALPFDALGAAALTTTQARALRNAVRGRVFFPRTPGYNSERLVYNTRYDGTRPQAVVQALDTRDVQGVVRWAARFGVPIVARSGGHSYAGYSTTGRGVVVDLSRLNRIRVANGRATVGAGVQLIDLQRALTRRGLSVPSGSCPSVGIAGLTLGGGHGLAGRRYGLTTDNLRAATIVTADGRIRQVDANTNEDLFWACRGGGGGNFGIVTSLHPPDPPRARRRLVLLLLALGSGGRGAGRLAGLRARCPGRAHLDLQPGHQRRRRVAARDRAGPVLRLAGRAAAAGPPARARVGGEHQHRQLELLLARAALGRLSRRGLSRLPHARHEPGRHDARGPASTRSPTTSTSRCPRAGAR